MTTHEQERHLPIVTVQGHDDSHHDFTNPGGTQLNRAKLLKLIEGVRQAAAFDMRSHATCFCGVAQRIKATDHVYWTSHAYWTSRHLAEWLEWPNGVNNLKGDRMAQAAELVLGGMRATKEQAIKVLEHLYATGEVSWDVVGL